MKLHWEEVSYVKIRFYIIHGGCLKDMFTYIKPKKCPVCHSKSIRVDVKVVGICVVLKWVSVYLKIFVNHEKLCHFYSSNKLSVACQVSPIH